MKNKISVYNNGVLTTIEVILNFKVEEFNKNYIAYCINDDGISEDVNVCISEIDMDSNPPQILDIKPEEVEAVLNFYEYAKNIAVESND